MIENDFLLKEKLEKERLEKEQLEKERMEKEKLEMEKLNKEGLENEKVIKLRLENEKLVEESLKKDDYDFYDNNIAENKVDQQITGEDFTENQNLVEDKEEKEKFYQTDDEYYDNYFDKTNETSQKKMLLEEEINKEKNKDEFYDDYFLSNNAKKLTQILDQSFNKIDNQDEVDNNYFLKEVRQLLIDHKTLTKKIGESANVSCKSFDSKPGKAKDIEWSKQNKIIHGLEKLHKPKSIELMLVFDSLTRKDQGTYVCRFKDDPFVYDTFQLVVYGNLY